MNHTFKTLMLFCACSSTQLMYGAGAGAPAPAQLPAPAKPAASALHVLANVATALVGGATPTKIAENPAPSPTSQLFPGQQGPLNASPVKLVPVNVYSPFGSPSVKHFADLFPGQFQ